MNEKYCLEIEKSKVEELKKEGMSSMQIDAFLSVIKELGDEEKEIIDEVLTDD